jgi:hypothetical protein
MAVVVIFAFWRACGLTYVICMIWVAIVLHAPTLVAVCADRCVGKYIDVSCNLLFQSCAFLYCETCQAIFERTLTRSA